MRSIAKSTTLAAAALLVGSTLAACGGSSAESSENLPADVGEAGGMEELVQRAEEEGELSLYAGTTEESTSKWIKDFESKYDIDVKLYRDGSTTLYQKWAQEVSGGVNNADILIQNVYQLWQEADAEGWITDYETQGIDGYDWDTVYPSDELVGSVYSLHQSIGAIVWNTDVVTPEQQEMLEEDPVAAMADPSFEGKIALGDTGGATTAGNYANIVINQADEYGWDWMDSVGANDPALFESQIPIAEQLVKGEYAITFGTDTLYNGYLSEGAPVQYAYPEPTNAATWMIGLPDKTPHPYAARLFMEWATSPEGHDLMAEYGTGTGTRTDWEDTREVSQNDWFETPEVWTGMATLDELQGEKFGEFVERVNTALGR